MSWPAGNLQVAALALKTDSFPTALEAICVVPSILGDKESLINILASLRRMAIAFSVAVAVSIPLGLMMGRNRYVASFFNPLLMITYPVPKAALMPIIMLWLGVGDIAKMLVIFLGVSLPVIYHSFRGRRGGRGKDDMVGRGHRPFGGAADDPDRVAGGIAGNPDRLPHWPRACAHHHGHQQMIARQSGAGNILFNALDMGQYETVYAMIIVIGAMGIGIDAAFEKLRSRLVDGPSRASTFR